MGKNQHKRPHVRFIEFENGRFYAKDFDNASYKFLTLYDLEENVLGEYAHIYACKWVTLENEIVSAGQIMNDMDALCKDGLLIDLYVDDYYKSNRAVQIKRIYRYLLTPTGEVKRYRGGGGTIGRCSTRKLYDLTAVDDVSAIGSLDQIIPNF